MSVAKTILKRLFRVYAHIYHQHFDSVMRLQEEAHLNTSFKHFIFFVQVSWKHWPLACSGVLCSPFAVKIEPLALKTCGVCWKMCSSPTL